MKTNTYRTFRQFAMFLILTVFLNSCTDNVTRNNPSLQGLKDNVMWRAKSSQAIVENGSLIISGLDAYERLTLRVNSRNKGTYLLGVNNSRTATFVDETNDEPLTFSTGINQGDGQIEITDYDEVNMTVSGTFRFNALNVDDNPLGGEILNFQEGVFYKVPIVTAQIPD